LLTIMQHARHNRQRWQLKRRRTLSRPRPLRAERPLDWCSIMAILQCVYEIQPCVWPPANRLSILERGRRFGEGVEKGEDVLLPDALCQVEEAAQRVQRLHVRALPGWKNPVQILMPSHLP